MLDGFLVALVVLAVADFLAKGLLLAFVLGLFVACDGCTKVVCFKLLFCAFVALLVFGLAFLAVLCFLLVAALLLSKLGKGAGMSFSTL